MAKILYVEDDATMVGTTRDILESLGGHDMAHAYDGVFAMQFLGVEPMEEVKQKVGDIDWKFVKNDWASKPGEVVLPDVIIADCMMPRMDGFTLVSQLAVHEKAKDIPVIVLTTKDKMEEPFRQLSNVVGFLRKPVEPDPLLELVNKALARS